MQYCDRIAAELVSALSQATEPAFFAIKTKLDLDPNGGFLRSTDKTVLCRDNKGNQYEISIKAKTVRSLTEILADLNKQHSRHGDPLGFLLGSLSTKLAFAAQDSSVLSTITPEEIQALQISVDAANEESPNDF